MNKKIHLTRILLPFFLLVTIYLTGTPAFSQDWQAPATAITVQPVHTETVAEIMERAKHAPPPTERKKIKKIRPNRAELPQNPLAIPAAFFPDNNQGIIYEQGQVTDAPQTVGTTFNGFSNTASTGPYPPDNMGAIGPTQYIVTVNGIIRSFNSATGVADGVLNVTPDVFFSSVMTPLTGGVTYNFTSDPRVRYDRYSGKWIMLIIDVPNGGSIANRVLIAVSNTSTITAGTTWFFSQFLGETGIFIDYPTIGVDINAVYIGGNMFSLAGSYLKTNGYVINRNNLVSFSPYTVYPFPGLVPSSAGVGPYTPQGVDNFDQAATEGYFIGVDNATFSKLMLRRVTNPAGVPSISGNISITVNTTSYPTNVPHLGNTGSTNGYLDAIDDRLYAAMIRGGHLWTAHTIKVDATGVGTSTGTRNGVRWYDITSLSATPVVTQSGTIFDPAATNPRYYFFPTVMVSGQGHAAFSMASAGANDRANAATTGRLSGDGLGTTQTIVLTTASATAYNPVGDPGPGRRWGDYSYVSLDPKDNMTMWMINQYCAGTNFYGSSVSKLVAPAPAMPSGCSPAMITAGLPSVNVTVTGTSLSGSGFYDPGANLPPPALAYNHISATVTGGVIVNSVTYTSPTQITLNLNTTGAVGGLQSINVTNPDGQVAGGSNLLRVCPVIAVVNPASLTATAGQVFSRSFTSTGGAPAITYSTSSTLPSGLTFSSTGVLSGIPAQTGNFPIVVTATDANGCTGTGTTYNLSITCPVVNPSVMASGPTAICPGGSVQLTSTGGNALQFAGAGNYVTIPGAINTNFSTNRITVEGWFYQTAVTTGNPVLVGEAYLGDGKVTFSVYLSGQQIVAGFFNGVWTTASSTSNLALNTWTHVAVTYDQTAIRIYLNGVAAGSIAATAVLPTGTEEWRLARRWDLAEYFSGRMDEVRIWNVARTQGQIQGSMSTTVAPATSGLVAYYRLNEGTGLSAADLTNHGYNGTFVGTPTWVIPSTAPLAGYSGYLWSNGATTSSITVGSAGNYSVVATDLYGCSGGSAPMAVTIKPLTGAAGAITGSSVTAQGHNGIAYSVPPVANATGYVWSLPAGASIASGTNTNNITVNFSASAVSGNITVYGTNDCGNGTPSAPFAVTVIPSNYSSGNVVVASGNVQCYSATQTILVAGGGTTFTVQSGGSATMIAGQNIRYQPVTRVLSGGYMHGYITTNNQYCGGMAPSMLTIVAGEDEHPVVDLSPRLKVYPNPTSGIFTIEFTGQQEVQKARIEIYSMSGSRVVNETLDGDRKYTLSIATMAPGIYFIRVAADGISETVKLIKL